MAGLRTDEEALAIFSEKDRWVRKLMGRIRPLLAAGNRPTRVVEVGSAEGLRLISLALMGYEAYGVEPLTLAVEQAKRLAPAMKAEIQIEPGVAENLPYPDNFCDCVVAFSVMEHTSDFDLALRECRRILKPGGVLWFTISNSICPVQNEIRRFPAFGWYPLALKRRIMRWAAEKHPALIANSQTPAMQWESPWSARRALRAAGFGEVWDRWDLRRQDEGKLIYRFIASSAITKTAADICVQQLGFAARKPVER